MAPDPRPPDDDRQPVDPMSSIHWWSAEGEEPDPRWSLANEQATRANIEHAIRRHLPAVTRPGDTVLIYWSGHGSRCADTDGDEKDGFDEYLVPHDGRVSDVEIQESSGYNSFDRAGLSAVQNATLPPLPKSYRRGELGVRLTIR